MTDFSGRTLGNYQVIEKLGQGGMGAVYRGRQLNMERDVAIKVLPAILAQDPLFAERFRREAQVIANLEHARILPVHDYGEQNDIAYLVMRLLDGGTLHERISNEGALPLYEAARILRQAAEGLSYAHRRSIVHRDMTTNNIMFNSGGDVYITDFGLARIVGGSSTITGSDIIGTPAFVSPEQGLGLKVDRRSDIYALGVALYEMTVGDLPFHGDTPMVVVVKHINEPLPDPHSYNPELSPAVVSVILKATSKNPEHRFQDCLEMADALDAAIGKDQAVHIAPEANLSPDRTPVVPIPGQAVRANLEQPTRRKASLWLWGVLGLIAVALLAALWFGFEGELWEDGDDDNPIISTTVPTEEPEGVTPADAVSEASATYTTTPTEADPTTTQSSLTQTATIEPMPTPVIDCAAGQNLIRSLEFHLAEPDGINALLNAEIMRVTIEDEWLVIPPLFEGEFLQVQTDGAVGDLTLMIDVEWHNIPASFTLITHGQRYGSGGYLFSINSERQARLERNNIARSSNDSLLQVFDGQSHRITFSVQEGMVVGQIDGQTVIEMQDQNPLPAGLIKIHAALAPVYLDRLGICGVMD